MFIQTNSSTISVAGASPGCLYLMCCTRECSVFHVLGCLYTGTDRHGSHVTWPPCETTSEVRWKSYTCFYCLKLTFCVYIRLCIIKLHEKTQVWLCYCFCRNIQYCRRSIYRTGSRQYTIWLDEFGQSLICYYYASVIMLNVCSTVLQFTCYTERQHQ